MADKKGYAYIDKYGFSHVSSDKKTAEQSAAPGTSVSDYSGKYSGGYARNETGGRVSLPLPGAKEYGNYNPDKGDIGLLQAGDYSKYIGSTIPIGQTQVKSTPSIPTGSGLTGAALQFKNLLNSGVNPTLAYSNMFGAEKGNIIPAIPTGAPSQSQNDFTPEQLTNLQNYKTDPLLGYNEIARAGTVYNQKIAAGDIEGAQRAHTWANQVRDYMGISDQYDPVSGANLNEQPTTKIPTGQTTTVTPPVPQYSPTGYTPVSAPYPTLKLSSGEETIVPTQNYVNQQYALQDQLYNKDYNERKLAAEIEAEANKIENQDWYRELFKNKTQAEIAELTRNANAPYSSGGGGSVGGLTPYQQLQYEKDTQKAMNDWVSKQVENDGRLMSDNSNYASLYDAWKTMYVNSMYGG